MENTPVRPIDRDRRLLIPLFCLIPTIVVLAVSYVTSKSVPAYYTKDAIEDILKARDSKNEKPGESLPKEAGLSAEPPQTEPEFIAERQKILQEKRNTLRKANANANRDYDTELKQLDDEKKDADARQAATNERFISNAGRISWGSYTIVYLVICGVAICAGLFSIWGVMESGPRIRVIIGALLVSAVIGAFSARFSNYWMPPGVIGPTIKEQWPSLINSLHLYESVIVAVGFLLAIACATLSWALPIIEKAATRANEKAKEAGEPASLTPEGVTVKKPDLPSTATDTNQEAASPVDEVKEDLRKRVRMLRILLYLAAAVLVTKVLQSQAFVSWAISYVDLYGISAAFDIFRRSVITQESLGYTIFLAALYLPAFIVLRERANAYAEAKLATASAADPNAPKDPGAFLQQNGLSFSFKEQLPRIVAILAPMLAASANTLLSNLFH